MIRNSDFQRLQTQEKSYQQCMIDVFGTDSAGAIPGAQECFTDSDCANLGVRCNLLQRQCQVTLASQMNSLVGCFLSNLDLVDQEQFFIVSV
jgi:hypothetical protein